MNQIAVLSVIQPKRPVNGLSRHEWSRANEWACPPELAELGYPVEAWNHTSGLFVMSAVEKPDPGPGEVDFGPEYHLSVSMSGQRCTAADALFALSAFGLLDAKEDNHVPSGRVRNFWRPVADRLSGYECSCVDNEPRMVEDKGDFVWRGITR